MNIITRWIRLNKVDNTSKITEYIASIPRYRHVSKYKLRCTVTSVVFSEKIPFSAFLDNVKI